MNTADFAVHVDDFGDAAIICPQCGFPTYTPIENDVTIGILIRLAQAHIAAHAMSDQREKVAEWMSTDLLPWLNTIQPNTTTHL